MPSCCPWQKKLLRSARTALHLFWIGEYGGVVSLNCSVNSETLRQWLLCSGLGSGKFPVGLKTFTDHYVRPATRPTFLTGKSTAIRECCCYVWQACSAILFSWIVNSRVQYCGKGLASPLSSLYFASEEPEFVVTFPLVLSNSFPGVLKVF